jgi:hypothetical protein
MLTQKLSLTSFEQAGETVHRQHEQRDLIQQACCVLYRQRTNAV